MGWISKIFSVLEETPNVVDRVLDTAEGLKESANKVSNKVGEYQINKLERNLDKLESSLSQLEDKWDIQYNQAVGRSNETKIQILSEYKIDFDYAIACKYNSIHYAGFNMYVVNLYGKYGVITQAEEIIIPIEYDFIIDYSEEKFCACKDKKWGFIDINNNVVIDFVYEDADSFSEGLASVSKTVDGIELYGYIDHSNELVIPFKYNYAECFKPNGLACVGLWDKARKEVQKGVINKDDLTIVNCSYSIIDVKDDCIAYAVEPFHSLKFFDLKGVPLEKDEQKEETPKNIIIPYFDSKMQYGYYIHTDDGDFCKIEPSFEKAYPLNKDGYAIVKKDNLYGIIKLITRR